MAYTRVNWEDLPSTNTPRNATNLNKMDAGIKDNDDRIKVNEDKLSGTNPMGSIVVDDINCKNLFNPNNFLKDMGISSDELIITNASTNLYYIPVEYGKTYIMSFTNNSSSGNVVYGFSNNIPTLNGSCTYNVTTCPSLNGMVFTPTSASQKYLCIRLRYDALQLPNITNIQIEVGSTATAYTPYKKIIKEENGYVKEDTTFYANDFKCRNIYNPTLTRSNMWLYNNGEIVTSADPNILSGFLKVEVGKKYTISGVPNTFTVRLCSYTGTTENTFKTCLINNEANVRTFVADADYVVFAVGSGTATSLTNIQLEVGEATPYTPYKDFDNTIVDITSDITFATNWSLTDGKLYKQGNRIFGTLQFHSSVTLEANSNNQEVIQLNHNLTTNYISGGFVASGQWSPTTGLCYIFIGNAGKITIVPSSSATEIRMQIDVVTTS